MKVREWKNGTMGKYTVPVPLESKKWSKHDHSITIILTTLLRNTKIDESKATSLPWNQCTIWYPVMHSDNYPWSFRLFVGDFDMFSNVFTWQIRAGIFSDSVLSAWHDRGHPESPWEVLWLETASHDHVQPHCCICRSSKNNALNHVHSHPWSR